MLPAAVISSHPLHSVGKQNVEYSEVLNGYTTILAICDGRHVPHIVSYRPADHLPHPLIHQHHRIYGLHWVFAPKHKHEQCLRGAIENVH